MDKSVQQLQTTYESNKFINKIDKIKDFRVYKSKRKLYEQEQVWKQICSDRNWPYYLSDKLTDTDDNKLKDTKYTSYAPLSFAFIRDDKQFNCDIPIHCEKEMIPILSTNTFACKTCGIISEPSAIISKGMKDYFETKSSRPNIINHKLLFDIYDKFGIFDYINTYLLNTKYKCLCYSKPSNINCLDSNIFCFFTQDDPMYAKLKTVEQNIVNYSYYNLYVVRHHLICHGCVI